MLPPLRWMQAAAVAGFLLTFASLTPLVAEQPAAGKTSPIRNVSTKAVPGKSTGSAGTFDVAPLDATAVSRQVDEIINANLAAAKVAPSPRTSDEDFLRRVTFDIAGTTPAPHEVNLFGLNPDPHKRAQVIDRLLESKDYARNWSQYWREVVFSRATEPRSRITQPDFEDWLNEKFATSAGWDEIATALLTAKGDVREVPETALIFAQGAEPAEVASEASRIFMGIQIQCANCHDHPTDAWKREQFHELTAFFPRIALRPKQNVTPRSFEIASVEGNNGRPDPRELFQNPERLIRQVDRNNDQMIGRNEIREDAPQSRIFNLLFQQADVNKDGLLTATEIKNMPVPDQAGRGTPEHYMGDLDNPNARGQLMQPVFFLNGAGPGEGLSDLDRRSAAARYITSRENPWFAKAFVNRIWGEMLGAGFYMPIDDMGPERTPENPEVLDLLAGQFAAHNYDIRWLFRTIANTETYQRQLRSTPTKPEAEVPAFAGASPTRLRSDQLYNSLMTVLGIDELGNRPPAGRPMGAGAERFGDRSPRGQFNTIFGFDPSTPQADLTGTIPQALFFMNSPLLQNLISSRSETRLARIVRENPDDADALSELYLLVLSREPTDNELRICREFLKQAPNRGEAYEDLMWSLLNSSEFQTKR